MSPPEPRLAVTIIATDGPALVEALDVLRGRLTNEHEQNEHGGQFGRRPTDGSNDEHEEATLEPAEGQSASATAGQADGGPAGQ